MTFFGTLFPNVGLNFEYRHLPIQFEVESVGDMYVPANNSANMVEYPSIIKLRYQKNDADTGKHPVRGSSDTGTDMFISFDYGKPLHRLTIPFLIYFTPYERCGYSPSLLFSEDGTTLYCVNNPARLSQPIK